MMTNYFNPQKEGDTIRGKVVDTHMEDKYGNELIVLHTKPRIFLDRNLNDPHSTLWALPAHASLKNQCEKVKAGDVLEVTYKGKKISKHGQEIHIYDVNHLKKEDTLINIFE